MAQTITLGKVSISPKGEYSASASYTFLDTVSHNGGAFLCLQNATGIEPGVTSGWQTYWMETSVGIANVELSAPAEGQARIIVTLSDGTTSSVDVSTTAIADGSITAAKFAADAIPEALGYNPGMVNPNLLDNWYFANPVNQRGQTSYNSPSYTIDRWRLYGGPGTVSIDSQGITITNPTTSSYDLYLTQQLEAPLSTPEYTVSVLTSSMTGNVYVQMLNADSSVEPNVVLELGLTKFTYTSAKALERLIIGVKPGASVTLKAAKLELGSVQTLAHQDENGNWVLNEIPNYFEQWIRCRRYYKKYEGITLPGVSHGSGGNSFLACIDLQDMRTIPALITGVVSWIELGGKLFDTSNNTYSCSLNNKSRITINTGNAIGNYTGGVAFFTVIEVSADL